MSGALLQGLIEANLAAAAAILLVLLVRPTTRRLFGAEAAYLLWLAPLLAAAATLAPQPAGGALAAPVVLQQAQAMAGRASDAASSGLALPLILLWLTGALASLALVAFEQRRFMAGLRPLQAHADPRLLRGGRPEAGPAVIGALRPRIVVPSDFESRYPPQERELILAHELAHLARGDAQANGLAALALCLAWFNPLVHLAVRLMRIDQEMACDARVLRDASRPRRLYGELLLKAQLAGDRLPLGCRWPATAIGPLRARISMLGRAAPSRARGATGALLASSLVLGCAGAAWAMQGSASDRTAITAPVWIAKPTGADLIAAYPPSAVAQGLNGQALLSCVVSRDGRLEGCTVLREAAADGSDHGFGAAALKLAPIFRMAARDANGARTAGERVRIPFRFMVPSANQP